VSAIAEMTKKSRTPSGKSGHQVLELRRERGLGRHTHRNALERSALRTVELGHVVRVDDVDRVLLDGPAEARVALIDAAALAAMKPSALLINVARGRVVDEAALIAALQQRRIAAAGLDVTREEPLPASSPLWAMPQVLLTPHSAGETQRYEDGVIDILLDNLYLLWRGEALLRNQVV